MNTPEYLTSIGFEHDQDYYLNVATVEEWQKWFSKAADFIYHFSVEDCLFCQAAIHAREDIKEREENSPFLRLCQICMFRRPRMHCGVENGTQMEVVGRARDRLAEVGIYVWASMKDLSCG